MSMEKLTKEQTLAQIQREMETAAVARKSGNEGMTRVCARRAAGIAIGYWLSNHLEKQWGADAMNRLRHSQHEPAVPAHVREAAVRLTTKITEQFTSPFPTDPLADSMNIIDYFLEAK